MSEGSERMRAFISVAVATATLETLQAFQRSLEEKLPRETVRWTPTEQMHLTLKFLGHVATAEVENLKSALAPIASHHRPLRLRAEGLGCFPSARSPRVIWVGLQGDLEPLQQLQEQIEQASGPWAEKEEKRAFRPHLTLGRVRETAGRRAKEIGLALQGITPPAFGEWGIDRFTLKRSQLSPKGAVHTVVAEFPLLLKQG